MTSDYSKSDRILFLETTSMLNTINRLPRHILRLKMLMLIDK